MFEKAKAMEKEQIEKAFDEGFESGYDVAQGDGAEHHEGVDYYNETFGGEK